jgi:histidyl-tRNA synthetase
MKKIRPISGFPEWLPEQKLIEDAYIARIRTVYESYGFTPIETAAVEPIEVLAEQGVTDKEIYGLRRLHDEDDTESRLGLHFDLTIPFSRYVAQHLDKLKFPFRRYQIQKVWRGERPQKGRFREFYQFDADLVARDELPLCCDAEIISVMNKSFKALDLGTYKIAVNNRKCVLGCLETLGITEDLYKEILIAVDKLHKIGRDATLSELEVVGATPGQAVALLDWCGRELAAVDFLHGAQTHAAVGLEKEGWDELKSILRLIPETALENIVFDPSLVRGLDYYTGLIFEVTLPEYPTYGSVGGGGRYENLVSRFSNQSLPGVGGSIGLTRLMDLIFTAKLHGAVSPKSLPQVMVTVLNEDQRVQCNKVAERARRHGVPTEVFFKSTRLGKQIEYASDRNIPFVVFLSEDGSTIEVKDLMLKSQSVVLNFDEWCKQLADSMLLGA